MPSKTCELDILPTKVLKQVIGAFVKYITLIINMSLQTSTSPNVWKNAIIRPFRKKKWLALELCNSRPVSNLSFFPMFWKKQF